MKPQLYIVIYSNQKMNEIDIKIMKLQIRSMTRYQYEGAVIFLHQNSHSDHASLQISKIQVYQLPDSFGQSPYRI